MNKRSFYVYSVEIHSFSVWLFYVCVVKAYPDLFLTFWRKFNILYQCTCNVSWRVSSVQRSQVQHFVPEWKYWSDVFTYWCRTERCILKCIWTQSIYLLIPKCIWTVRHLLTWTVVRLNDVFNYLCTHSTTLEQWWFHLLMYCSAFEGWCVHFLIYVRQHSFKTVCIHLPMTHCNAFKQWCVYLPVDILNKPWTVVRLCNYIRTVQHLNGDTFMYLCMRWSLFEQW